MDPHPISQAVPRPFPWVGARQQEGPQQDGAGVGELEPPCVVRGSCSTLAVAPQAVWKLGDAGLLSAYVFGVSCLVSGETRAKAQYHSTLFPHVNSLITMAIFVDVQVTKESQVSKKASSQASKPPENVHLHTCHMPLIRIE